MTTVLLIPFQGTNNSTNIVDKSPTHRAISIIGDTKISTAVNDPFGNNVGVGYFDGAADGITFANDADFDFGSGDFTIEFWAYRQGSNANYSRIFNADGDDYNGVAIAVDSSDNLVVFGSSTGNTWDLWSEPVQVFMPLNTWQHYALVRDGNNVKFYVDGSGSEIAILSGETLHHSAQLNLCIGAQHGINTSFNGLLSNFRIKKGEAVYLADFTPPSTAFPTDDIIIDFAIDNSVEIVLNVIDSVIIEFIFLDVRDYIDDIVIDFQISNNTVNYLGHESIDLIMLDFQINNNYSYQVYIPPNWIQRNYIARIGNLELPISSFNATLSVSGSSYVTLQISALTSQLLDEIIARSDEEIIITRSHLYSDNTTKEREFIRVNYESLISDTGPKSGTSITITGRKNIAVSRSKEVTETNAFYRNFSDGKLRYRLPVNDEINLGDRLFIDDTDFIVGKITYYISSNNEFMECAEYIADGTDLNGIGNNIRPTPLQAYLVDDTNLNYYLWQEQGYLFNGRANNPADSTNYPFNLWYDSTGLLWYAAGFAVYEVDGIT